MKDETSVLNVEHKLWRSMRSVAYEALNHKWHGVDSHIANRAEAMIVAKEVLEEDNDKRNIAK